MIITKIKVRLKVHIVSNYFNHENTVSSQSSWINEGNVVNTSLEDCDIVLFMGGEDIHPKYYNQKVGYRTDNRPDNMRDQYEFDIFKKAVKMNKKIIGICRGCQLLTVANGGILIQDVKHHIGYHKVIDKDTKVEYLTNSIHHQMCWPYYLPKEDYEVLAYSKKEFFNNERFSYLDENNNQFTPTGSKVALKDELDFKEPEVIYYPKTNALGIQGHPEMMVPNSPFVRYINEIILNKLININDIYENRNHSL